MTKVVLSPTGDLHLAALLHILVHGFADGCCTHNGGVGIELDAVCDGSIQDGDVVGKNDLQPLGIYDGDQAIILCQDGMR